MRICLAYAAIVTVVMMGDSEAQVVGNTGVGPGVVGAPYVGGVGMVGTPPLGEGTVVVNGQEPIGAPTGSPRVQGGMGSLPGTGAGASMDAKGNLTLPNGTVR